MKVKCTQLNIVYLGTWGLSSKHQNPFQLFCMAAREPVEEVASRPSKTTLLGSSKSKSKTKQADQARPCIICICMPTALGINFSRKPCAVVDVGAAGLD